MPKLLAAGFGGWLLGAKIHSGRATKKLKKVHQKEQKNLYTQYYNDVYKLQEKNAELQYTANYLKEQLEATQREYEDEKTQRDYDEFKVGANDICCCWMLLNFNWRAGHDLSLFDVDLTLAPVGNSVAQFKLRNSNRMLMGTIASAGQNSICM